MRGHCAEYCGSLHLIFSLVPPPKVIRILIHVIHGVRRVVTYLNCVSMSLPEINLYYLAEAAILGAFR